VTATLNETVEGITSNSVHITGVEDIVSTSSSKSVYLIQSSKVIGISINYSISINTRLEFINEISDSEYEKVLKLTAHTIAGNITATLTTSVESGSFDTSIRVQAASSKSKLANSTSGPVKTQTPHFSTLQYIPHPTSAPTKPDNLTAWLLSIRTVPEIFRTEISVDSSSADLAIILDSPRYDNPGSVYCLAKVRESTSPTDVSQIKSDGTGSEAYLTINKIVYLTVSALVPLTAYDLYCYVETIYGYSTPLSQISKNSFETTCCKDVVFSVAPQSVFGDVTKYAGTRGQNYQFTFSVTAKPSVDLKVEPRLRDANGEDVDSTLVSVNPPSFTFTSTTVSQKLNGVFFLSAKSTLSGVYTLFLRLSGTSTHEYNQGDNTTVTIISSFAPLPAPIMSFSRFSSNGAKVFVMFDSPTDLARISQNLWPCNLVFTYVGVNRTSCQWLNASALQITFADTTSSSILVPYSKITLLGGRMRRQCVDDGTCDQNSVNVMQSIIVQNPPSPVIPVIALNVPPKSNLCDDLVIDASTSSGNSGRPWKKLQWTLNGRDANTSSNIAATAYLNSIGDISVRNILPNTFLVATTYSIKLELQNFIGVTRVAEKIVEIIRSTNTPYVSIEGARYRELYRASTLSISGYGSLPGCSGSTISLRYQWNVTLNGVNQGYIKSTSNDKRTLKIAPYTLQSTKSYVMTLTVYAGSEFSRDSVTVFVPQGAIVVSVAGKLVEYSVQVSNRNWLIFSYQGDIFVQVLSTPS
jgi:hypothetical protein